MSRAASTTKLAELHEMLAEVLLEDLRQSKAEGIPLPAANLGVIRQFLKDNNISASIDADDMAQLRDEFAQELQDKRATKRAAMQAAIAEDDMSAIFH